MEFCIECKVSGVGQKFVGTLDEAIVKARSSIRQVGWRQVLWLQPENRRVAEVWEDGKWVSASMKEQMTPA